MEKTPKSQLKNAWQSFTKAWKNVVKSIWHTAKWLYEAIDASDLFISEKMDQRFGESTDKLINFVQKNIIKILLATSPLIYWWHAINNKVQDKNKEKIEIKIDDENNATLLNLKDLDYKIKTPDWLVWRSLWDLYSHYLWYGWKSSKIWDTIIFKPNEILEELYKKKFDLDNNKWFTVAKSHYENTIKNIDFELVEPTNINVMKNKMKESIKLVNQNFDREKFGSEKLKNNTEKTILFKSLCNKIDEKALLSYGMTELMPSSDWKLNQEVLDFMLQNGGEKFVMNIPAIADSYTSFGLYQFTSFAIYDTWKKQEWASIINLYLPGEYRIAWSVTKLAIEDHHKAAYMFAMYNIYSLVFEADSEMMKALNLLLKQNDNNNLTQLIAIMHNLPANWKVFLKEWYKLNSNKKYLDQKQWNNKEKYNYDINNNGQIDLYEAYVSSKKTSHGYWKKTYYNRTSL